MNIINIFYKYIITYDTIPLLIKIALDESYQYLRLWTSPIYGKVLRYLFYKLYKPALIVLTSLTDEEKSS